MKTDYKYSQGDLVSYATPQLSGRGLIVGIAHTPIFGSGAGYIIQDISKNLPNETYPYSHFCVAEGHLRKIEGDPDSEENSGFYQRITRG